MSSTSTFLKTSTLPASEPHACDPDLHIQTASCHLASLVPSKHTLYRVLNHTIRVFRQHFSESGLFHSTHISGMMIVDLLIQLSAGHFDLLRIYDDNIIAGIFMRG